MKINKPILAWTEEDLEILRDDPYNLEDMNIEYKVQYNGDPDELRRDIVSFANSVVGGYILYSIRDDPFELIGMTREEIDNLKNTIDHIINLNIDPPPISNPIYLSSGLYVLGVQVFPKEKGLYGIRRINNPNKPNFRSYSFWIRSDGRKRQLSMEEVNTSIINTDRYKKFIEVRVELGLMGMKSKLKEFISVHGVNKSIRPITIRSYGFIIYVNNENKWLSLWLPAPNFMYPTTVFNTPPRTKLLDGDSCSGYYPITLFKEDITNHNITLPTVIKGLINTNDGTFYSEEKNITNDMIYD